jgi:hypothetical protein
VAIEGDHARGTPELGGQRPDQADQMPVAKVDSVVGADRDDASGGGRWALPRMAENLHPAGGY